MARFFSSAVNGRGNLCNHGGWGHSAGEVHLRGWDAGVEVEPIALPDGDAFDVYMTGGSHKPSSRQKLGRVMLQTGSKAPVFIPAERKTDE